MNEFRLGRKNDGREIAGLIGFGISNRGVSSALADRFRFRIRSKDPIDLPPFFERRLGDGWLNDIDEKILFRSPSVRPDLPALVAAKAAGASLSSDAEYFYSHVRGSAFAVTGSDGKSTTTALSARLLTTCPRFTRSIPCGNIGVALTPQLACDTPTCAYVTELSSFQLMTLSPHCERALITNITENHLNWHHSMAEYLAAKLRIFEKCARPVLNADEPSVVDRLLMHPDVVYSMTMTARELCAFAPEHTVTLDGDSILLDGRAVVKAGEIRLPGRHGIQNVMAAIALTAGFADPEGIAEVVRTFSGMPHRAERIGSLGGVTFIDSSIDSTPARTVATLAAMTGPCHLLLGGRGKGVSFAPIRAALDERIRGLYLFGEARFEIQKALEHTNIPTFLFPTMREATSAAAHAAEAGESVLLSPAATSFDEFSDFAARGDAFRAQVFPDGKTQKG